jgi:hypothetical protein
MPDWKKQAARRRDYRQAKADESIARTWPGKKDLHQWCRGREGVEHTPRCMPYTGHPLLKEWRELVCTACGKRLAWWSPSLDPARYPREKPDWVTE